MTLLAKQQITLVSAGVIVGVLGTLITIRFFFMPDYEEIGRLKQHIETLEDESAILKTTADKYLADAQEADTRFNEEFTKHQTAREELEAKLRARNKKIKSLEEEVTALRGELEEKMTEIENLQPDELAQEAEALVKQAYPETSSNASFEFDILSGEYRANRPAALGFTKSLTETLSLRKEVKLHMEEIASFKENLADSDKQKETFRLDLSAALQDIEKWKKAERAARLLNENSLKRLSAQNELIRQYERKLFWRKIQIPLFGVAGVVGGYFFGKEIANRK